MRFDDERARKLTAAERREFDALAQRLTDDQKRQARWRHASVLFAAALVALVALVLSLGRTPVIVPFAAFVFAVVALHQALADGRARQILARLARALGLVDSG